MLHTSSANLRLTLGKFINASRQGPAAPLKAGYIQQPQGLQPRTQQFSPAVPRVSPSVYPHTKNTAAAALVQEPMCTWRLGVLKQPGHCDDMLLSYFFWLYSRIDAPCKGQHHRINSGQSYTGRTYSHACAHLGNSVQQSHMSQNAFLSSIDRCATANLGVLKTAQTSGPYILVRNAQAKGGSQKTLLDYRILVFMWSSGALPVPSYQTAF